MSDCTKCKYAEWDCYDSSTVGKTKVLCGCKNDLILPVKDCKDFEEMGETMEFPNTFDEFAGAYGFIDKDEIYTNGIELIPVFRVEQWLEHIQKTTQTIDKDVLLSLTEVYVNLKNYDFDTFGNYKMDINEAKKIINAVERLKLNGWILADQEHNPKENGFYIVTLDGEIAGKEKPFVSIGEFENGIWLDDTSDYKCVLAWMPFPSPYNEEK